MEDRKQEFYDMIADGVRVLPEGAEPSPGSMVIEVPMTEGEVKQLIREIPSRNGSHPITGEVQPSEDEIQIRAAFQAQKEKKARELSCQQAVEKVLAEHNCAVSASFKLGEQMIPTQQLVNLPVMVMITSL